VRERRPNKEKPIEAETVSNDAEVIEEIIYSLDDHLRSIG
jgi:hypothetical protein